jgi:hypothetical protein
MAGMFSAGNWTSTTGQMIWTILPMFIKGKLKAEN